MPETPVLVTILIILSASFLRSAVGFGDALVSVPPLTLLLGTETAMPLVVLVGLTIAGTILAFNWKSVRFSAAAKLIGAAMLGILPGAMMLRFMPESYLKIMVGLVVAGFGLYNLRRPVLPHLPGGKTTYLFGFVAGLLGGATAISGPPVVIYGQMRRWSPGHFRATMQGFFFPTGLMIALEQGASGMWTSKVGWLYLIALPTLATGIFLGGIVNRRMTPGKFNKLVYTILVISGLVLIFSS